VQQTNHRPVLLEQVIEQLRPRPGGRYVDLTLGAGGHARRILEESSPDGMVLGLDRDPFAVRLAQKNLENFGARLQAVHGRFSQLPHALDRAGWNQVDGMLADLGVSSLQLDNPDRGRPGRAPDHEAEAREEHEVVAGPESGEALQPCNAEVQAPAVVEHQEHDRGRVIHLQDAARVDVRHW